MVKWPKMVSTKDIAYISDMFNWNNTLYKKLIEYQSYCDDEELVKYIDKIAKIVDSNKENLVCLLESGEKCGK